MSLPIYLKQDDVNKILSVRFNQPQSLNDRNRLMVRLMLTTGLRVGELTNLQVEQIDFEERLIFVRRGKGGKDRIVFLEPETAKLLKAYLGDRNSGRVFPIKPRRVQRIVKRMARVAGVRNADLITPHKLRHTFSINWVQHGGDIESLRRLLGHSSLSTTQIYLNFDFQYVRQVYDRLYASKNQERRLFS